MANFLQVCQIISAILLILVILLQHRGTGIGGAFGGEDLSYRGRRGVEKLLFRATVFFSFIFAAVIIAQFLV